MKALCLFSGGLDSLLATLLMKEQGIEVEGVCFVSPFFGKEKAEKWAKVIGVPLFIRDIGDRLISLLNFPPHGFGKAVNPCIDCHILMIKEAGELAKKRGASFLVTGEVLGERPKSQTRRALKIVEEESGWGGWLVRPLTAKNLPPTIPELKGWIEREKLLGIKGRGRKEQFALARKYGFSKFPTPAGGCLLTDPAFARRMRDLMRRENLRKEEIELLKWGRHFRLSETSKLVVGRSYKEDKVLEKLALSGDILLQAKNVSSPLGLLREGNENLIPQAASLLSRYADSSGKIWVRWKKVRRGKEGEVEVIPMKEERVDSLRVDRERNF